MAGQNKISSSQIENISKLFGNLLSGSKISKIFRDIKVIDKSGESTKWRRLDSVFKFLLNKDNSIDTILNLLPKHYHQFHL